MTDPFKDSLGSDGPDYPGKAGQIIVMRDGKPEWERPPRVGSYFVRSANSTTVEWSGPDLLTAPLAWLQPSEPPLIHDDLLCEWPSLYWGADDHLG